MRQMSSTIVLLSAMCASVFCGCGREEASRNALKPVAPPAEMPPDYVVAMVNGTPDRLTAFTMMSACASVRASGFCRTIAFPAAAA